LVYRFFCLQSHYRKALTFSWENLDNAAGAYKKLLRKIAALDPRQGTADEAVLQDYRKKFLEQVGNDLNTAQGITLVYDALKAPVHDAAKLAVLTDFDQVLGLSLVEKGAALREKEAAQAKAAPAPGGFTIQGEGDPAVDALVLQRCEAKKAKNFAEADRLREELRGMGVEVTDLPAGAVWRRV